MALFDTSAALVTSIRIACYPGRGSLCSDFLPFAVNTTSVLSADPFGGSINTSPRRTRA
jgi:hypothetical protein